MKMKLFVILAVLVFNLFFGTCVWSQEEGGRGFLTVDDAVALIKKMPQIFSLVKTDEYRGFDVIHWPDAKAPYFKIKIRYRPNFDAEDLFEDYSIKMEKSKFFYVNAYTAKVVDAAQLLAMVDSKASVSEKEAEGEYKKIIVREDAAEKQLAAQAKKFAQISEKEKAAVSQEKINEQKARQEKEAAVAAAQKKELLEKKKQEAEIALAAQKKELAEKKKQEDLAKKASKEKALNAKKQELAVAAQKKEELSQKKKQEAVVLAARKKELAEKKKQEDLAKKASKEETVNVKKQELAALAAHKKELSRKKQQESAALAAKKKEQLEKKKQETLARKVKKQALIDAGSLGVAAGIAEKEALAMKKRQDSEVLAVNKKALLEKKKQETLARKAKKQDLINKKKEEAKVAAARKKENIELKKDNQPDIGNESLGALLSKSYQKIAEKKLEGSDQYRRLMDKDTTLYLMALKDPDVNIRQQAVETIDKLSDFIETGKKYQIIKVIPILTELLHDKNEKIVYASITALGKLGTRGDKVILENIMPFTKSQDVLIKKAAVGTLCSLSGNAQVPELIGLLKDESVNKEVIRALWQIRDESAVEPLVGLLQKKEYFYLQRYIIEALVNIGGGKGIPSLIGLCNREAVPIENISGDLAGSVPYMGVDVVNILVQQGKTAFPYLIESLKSKDYLIRLYSAYALGKIKDKRALEPLSQALSVEDDFRAQLYIMQAVAEIKGEKFNPAFADLDIKVVSAKEMYDVQDEVEVSVVLGNNQATPVVINTVSCKNVNELLGVFGPDDSPVPYSCSGEEADALPKKTDFVILKPKETYTAGPFAIKKCYDISNTGKYKILAAYENNFTGFGFGVYAWSGAVKSKPAEITIDKYYANADNKEN